MHRRHFWKLHLLTVVNFIKNPTFVIYGFDGPVRFRAAPRGSARKCAACRKKKTLQWSIFTTANHQVRNHSFYSVCKYFVQVLEVMFQFGFSDLFFHIHSPRSVLLVCSRPGVTYWVECRSLMWHVGQSVAPYCRILGGVSRTGVAYWAECRALLSHIGQSVAAWCDMLGRVSRPGAYWAESRGLVWHIGQRVAAWCDISGRVSHLGVTYRAERRALLSHIGRSVAQQYVLRTPPEAP